MLRGRWVSPLVTLFDAAWVFVDAQVVGVLPALSKGTRCFFPCETVLARYGESGWEFRHEIEERPDGFSQIAIFRTRTDEYGLWAPTTHQTFSWIRDQDNSITEHSAGFLRSLESWMTGEPDGENSHALALQTVRTIIKHTSIADPGGGGYQFRDSSVLWLGVAHNIFTAVVTWIGLIAALAWANQAAARRLAAAREAANRCPACSYDIRGLRDTRCPECGGDLP